MALGVCAICVDYRVVRLVNSAPTCIDCTPRTRQLTHVDRTMLNPIVKGRRIGPCSFCRQLDLVTRKTYQKRGHKC